MPHPVELWVITAGERISQRHKLNNEIQLRIFRDPNGDDRPPSPPLWLRLKYLNQRMNCPEIRILLT